MPLRGTLDYSFSSMFEDFIASDLRSGQPLHCIYQATVTAISTRHADAVDIKFLVGDRGVWVALPHPAWQEYHQRTGKNVTDALAVEIAGHYLKTIIENGEEGGRDLYALTVAETLQHLDAVLQSAAPAAK